MKHWLLFAMAWLAHAESIETASEPATIAQSWLAAASSAADAADGEELLDQVLGSGPGEPTDQGAWAQGAKGG